jgi:tyrosyl-tRNA synthetase
MLCSLMDLNHESAVLIGGWTATCGNDLLAEEHPTKATPNTSKPNSPECLIE